MSTDYQFKTSRPRPALRPYADQARYYMDALMKAHGRHNKLGVFTSRGTRFRATLMETSTDYRYFGTATGQTPGEDDMFLLDAGQKRYIDFRGAVFLEELGRSEKATGA